MFCSHVAPRSVESPITLPVPAQAPISQASWDFVGGANGSSYTACIYEVALGNLDMCVFARDDRVPAHLAFNLPS